MHAQASLLVVHEDLVGSRRHLELLFITRGAVGVVLHALLAVRLLDRSRVRLGRYPKGI